VRNKQLIVLYLFVCLICLVLFGVGLRLLVLLESKYLKKFLVYFWFIVLICLCVFWFLCFFFCSDGDKNEEEKEPNVFGADPPTNINLGYKRDLIFPGKE
jgi:energy-coupling factor transporter transmembrane protein EcfT